MCVLLFLHLSLLSLSWCGDLLRAVISSDVVLRSRGFSASRTVRNKFLSFVNDPTCDTVRALYSSRKQTRTIICCNTCSSYYLYLLFSADVIISSFKYVNKVSFFPSYSLIYNLMLQYTGRSSRTDSLSQCFATPQSQSQASVRRKV